MQISREVNILRKGKSKCKEGVSLVGPRNWDEADATGADLTNEKVLKDDEAREVTRARQLYSFGF